jgi:hypothetical protein
VSVASDTAVGRRGDRARARPPCALALAVAAVALAACGAADTAKEGPPRSVSNPHAAQPQRASPGAAADPEARPDEKRADDVNESTPASTPGAIAARQRAVQRGASARREPAPAARAKRKRGRRTLPATTPISARRPCTLVTKRQARALIGVPIQEPLQAAQGPTCIYRSVTGDRFVTLAVQDTSLGRLRAQLHGSRRVDVAHRTGYCGTLGRPLLHVAVTPRRVLTVSAPCRLAARFAVRAVSSLRP